MDDQHKPVVVPSASGDFRLARPSTEPPAAPATSPVDPLVPAIVTWQKSRAPSDAAVMLRHLKPAFDRAIRQYVPDQDTPLLRGEAKQIALSTLGDYDPARGTPETFLRPHLQRLQRRAIAANNIISVPERVLMLRQQLQAAERELEDQLGRPPSTQTLADHLGVPIKRINYIRQVQVPLSESEATGEDESGDPVEPTVRQDSSRTIAEFVYDSLSDEKDRLILELSLGLHGRKPLKATEIAARLRLTPSAVNQRASKLAQQLSEIRQAGLF